MSKKENPQGEKICDMAMGGHVARRDLERGSEEHERYQQIINDLTQVHGELIKYYAERMSESYAQMSKEERGGLDLSSAIQSTAIFNGLIATFSVIAAESTNAGYMSSLPVMGNAAGMAAGAMLNALFLMIENGGSGAACDAAKDDVAECFRRGVEVAVTNDMLAPQISGKPFRLAS